MCINNGVESLQLLRIAKYQRTQLLAIQPPVRSKDVAKGACDGVAETVIAAQHIVIDGVAVQHAAAQLLQRPQGAGFPGAGGTCDPYYQRPRRFNDMEARGFFQTVAHRQSQAAFIRTLGEDLCHVGTIEGAQGIKHMLRLSQLVTGRSQTVDGVTFKQRGIFIKTDHAAVLCQMGGDICGGGARRTGNDRDRGLGGIVAILHTGRLGLLAVRQLLPHRLVHCYRAQNRFQCFQR